jgi:hypothetical protein
MAAAGAVGCHVDPPPAPVPTCSEVADHVYALLPKSGRATAIRDAMEHRCDADFWSERTRSCIAEEPALDASHKCRDTLTAPQRAQLDAALAAIATEPTVPKGFAPMPCPAQVSECIAVCAGFDRLAACQNLPPNAREMMRQSWLQAMVQITAMPVDAQRQICSKYLQSLQLGAGCH